MALAAYHDRINIEDPTLYRELQILVFKDLFFEITFFKGSL